MGLESTRAILRDRMGPEEPERTATASEREVTPRASGRETGEAAPQAALGFRDSDENKPEENEDENELRAVSLKVTQKERSFLNDMAAILDGLPRRTLRFIKTYRIIKASFGGAEFAHLEEHGFQALITLLAIGIIAKDDFPRIVDALRAQATSIKPLNIQDVLTSSDIRLSSVRDCVQRGFELANGASGADFARYATLASRFSFHQGLRAEPQNGQATKPEGTTTSKAVAAAPTPVGRGRARSRARVGSQREQLASPTAES